jgi:hypothetical protein
MMERESLSNRFASSACPPFLLCFCSFLAPETSLEEDWRKWKNQFWVATHKFFGTTMQKVTPHHFEPAFSATRQSETKEGARLPPFSLLVFDSKFLFFFLLCFFFS